MTNSPANCVLISDVHFTPSTIILASASVHIALSEARRLKVPFVDAGDLLDSKDVIRAVCANEVIKLYEEFSDVRKIILVGNHTLVHEKSKEHALNFLRPYADVIQTPIYDIQLDAWLIPYHSDPEELLKVLEAIPKGSRIIAHQGVQGASMGHYVVDKTSLPREAFADFRVISGHYHKAQDIKCGRPRKGAVGLFSYIGNPYSLSFSEANDGPKGYAILREDGLLERVPLKLRRHVVVECDLETLNTVEWRINPEDLLWLKVTGPKSELDKINKKHLGDKLFGHSNFKLDLIPLEDKSLREETSNMTHEQLVDSMIDNLQETTEQKEYLKSLWKAVV